jgi:hypothetical protein
MIRLEFEIRFRGNMQLSFENYVIRGIVSNNEYSITAVHQLDI